MKEKRNCGMNNYPMYPNMMMPPAFGPIPNGDMMNFNTFEQQFNNIQQELNNLDQRITRLEKMNSNTTTYNKYNDSNYYMV